ncbi:MAG: anaerobic sulfatase maturase [Oscillospiraceae bacterium]
MKTISLLIKPASSLCNLRCKYCFYADVSNLRSIKSFGIMQENTVSAMLSNVFSEFGEGDTVNFAFQGGEPTMAGLDFFKSFIALASEKKGGAKVNYSLQTNGILLDDEWCEFLTQHNFLVGLSLDGAVEMNDENRVDEMGKGTYKRIMAAKAFLDKHKTEYNILFVLTKSHARYAKKVWNFLLQNDVHYVQFIPCLEMLNTGEASPNALTPDRFAAFYTELFILWEQELAKGHYVSVKFFDDLFNLLTKGQITACGFTGFCQPQFVIEADGGVYPCDFYVLDEWKAGNITKNTPTELLQSEIMQRFLHRRHSALAKCGNCEYLKLCGGGCPRMAQNMYHSVNGDFCGYKSFLQSNWERMEHVAKTYLR